MEDAEDVERNAFNAMLRELREILHRRGRISSRNEALDELSKLLFAHIMSIVSGGPGISSSLLHDDQRHGDQSAESTSATRLRHFVRTIFEKRLPAGLAHELDHNDYELRIKPQEVPLAVEVIECFEKLAPKHRDNGGGLPDVDMLNDAFGSFLADSFRDEKELGQYLTPSEVVQFVVQLAMQAMSPQELALLSSAEHCADFGFILDPSCGTASFLTALTGAFYTRIVSSSGRDSAADWLNCMVNRVVVGIDKSERMVKLALTSMGMFGLPAARLHLANALLRTGPDATITAALEGRVRLLVTNPPFGAEYTGEDLVAYKIANEWVRRPLATVDSELLFLERYLDWLMPGGQCLAIVPDSILTNQGIYEDLRSHLADQIELRGVISLPSVTFGAAGTSTKTSILHFRKRDHGSRFWSSTYFAICGDVGYSVSTRESQRTKVSNGASDLPQILREYTTSADQLRLGRRESDVEHSARWDATFHASLPLDIMQRLAHSRPTDLKLADIADLSNEQADPRRWGHGTFEYIEISDVDTRTSAVYSKTIPCAEAPSRARKVVHAGDVLVSTVRPERRAVGAVRVDQDGAICTTGFAVLRPKGVNALTLAYLLKTDFVNAQLRRCNMGIAYPAIDERSLLDVVIPVGFEDIAAIDEHARAIVDLEERLRLLRDDFRATVESAASENGDPSQPTSAPTPPLSNRPTPRRERTTSS